MTDRSTDADKELEQILNSHRTKIRIVGAGGGGNNTVSRLLEVGIAGVEVIAVNTDAQDLLFAKADHKILLGKTITNGLGAGSDPKKGEESAKESLQEIEDALVGSDMVFVTCGLGGGTGTGSAPVVAEVAKNLGALTIAIVTLPFEDEGVVRWDNAIEGLEDLRRKVDTVIVVQNDRLLDLVPDLSLSAAFRVADEILVNAVKGITELVTEKGLVNLDFADVRTIMNDGGLAMIGIGESDSEQNAEEAAEKALENPLLDVDVGGAKSALINITGGKELSLRSSKTIMKIIADRLDPTAKIIWGARLDESMQESLRVMLIVTCLRNDRRATSEIDRAIRNSTGSPVKGSETNVPNEFLVKPQKKLAEHSEYSQVGQQAATAGRAPEEQAPVAPHVKDEEASQKEEKVKKGRKVFSEIFVEESRADIGILETAVKNLLVGEHSTNETRFREIKSACKSIYNASELFSLDKISEFAELTGDLTERALKSEFDLTEGLLEIYREVPATLDGMINEQPGAFEAGEEIKGKFENILELLREPTEAPPVLRRRTETTPRPPEKGEVAVSGTEHENGHNGNGSTPEEADKAELVEEADEKTFSSVKDAVKFVDKLL